MSIKVNPPPLQVPAKFLEDKASSAFFNALLNTIYQLWTAVYGLNTSAKIKTTDATPTGLIRSPVREGSTVMLVCTIVARRTGGASGTVGDSAFYVITGAFKNVAGVMTGIGTPDKVVGEDQAGWDVGFSSTADSAVVVVTGAAGNDIVWQGQLSVYTAGS